MRKSGAKFHTIETAKDNTQSFEARAKWCNEAIITLATGGLLTVATAPDSGTLAGSAHTDSFTRLCAASARSISSVVTRQWLHRMLRETFPEGPLLVRFELAPEPADERADMAALFAQLLQAGWKPEAATVAEAMGFAVEEAEQSLPVTLDATSGHPLPALDNTEKWALENRDEVPESEEEPVDDGGEPLTPEELEALRSLAEVSLEELVVQDAETAEAALTEAVAGASDEDAAADDELENRTYKRDRNGQFASTGAAQHRPGHSRASKGNPKNPTTQSNTPLKAAPGAKAQAQVDAVEHALKATEKKGKVPASAYADGKPVNVDAGHPGFYGTRHAAKHFAPGDTDRRSTARAIGVGETEKVDGGISRVHKGKQAILKPDKERDGMKFITGYKK